MRTTTTALLLLLAAAVPAFAQPARVDAVQAPAWLERGGRTVPLAPGTVLGGQDKVLTGANARVRVKLGEGSDVRLGEYAEFTLDRAEDRGGTFRAALAVLKGAFRFTTNLVARAHPRDVTIRVKNVTAGIRGTDLWGKSTDERDLVCLLEGAISVGSEGFPTVKLDTPNDFYQRPRAGGEPQVSKVDAAQVALWSKETALEDDAAAREGRGWRIVAATLPNRDDALRMARALRVAGFAADVAPGPENATLVRVGAFATESQARTVMGNLRGHPGVLLPKVVPIE